MLSNKSFVQIIVLLAATITILWGCGAKKNDPLAPVLVSSQANYMEANKEAVERAGPALQKFGVHQPLSTTDETNIMDSIRLYRGILAYKPSDAAPYLALGMCYQVLGMDQRAIDSFNSYLVGSKALKGPGVAQSRTDTYWLLSKTYYSLHAYGESANQATKAIKLDPNIARYYTQRASALLQEKNYKSAKLDAEHALKLNPQDEHAQGLLMMLNSNGKP